MWPFFRCFDLSRDFLGVFKNNLTIGVLCAYASRVVLDCQVRKKVNSDGMVNK